ncbi:hypothetical protein BO71DRAFT_413396 [Aspergillus ellipticus CBS 707.79]|uniref:Uncharacterized protein n=1 Tax=Aspergillus ellipticus CBS 707.79 TaxID=1448320 RepID=A0A319CWC3_9EURO|nr:hypothetical protein BO71DRAFT_413396 [Aspergillus ellipticus CBS 707.79]
MFQIRPPRIRLEGISPISSLLDLCDARFCRINVFYPVIIPVICDAAHTINYATTRRNQLYFLAPWHLQELIIARPMYLTGNGMRHIQHLQNEPAAQDICNPASPVFLAYWEDSVWISGTCSEETRCSIVDDPLGIALDPVLQSGKAKEKKEIQEECHHVYMLCKELWL